MHMAKRPDAEVLEYILMNFLLLSLRAQDAELAALESILDAAVLEAEYELIVAERSSVAGELPDAFS
jgi:hypothetical protein